MVRGASGFSCVAASKIKQQTARCIGARSLMAYAAAGAGFVAVVVGVVGLIIAPSPGGIGWFAIACFAGLPALAVGVLVARCRFD